MSIFNEDKKLKIFEDFKVIKKKTNSGNSNTFITSGDEVSWGNGESWGGKSKNKMWILRKRIIQTIKKNKWNAFKFFKDIKVVMNELDSGRCGFHTEIDQLIEKANASHQTALVEQLEDQKKRMKNECGMISNGVTLFLTEEDLVKFSNAAPRELKLDWIKNFSRLMPQDVYDELDRITSANLFDNYVILHYDPKDNGSKLTKKEIERKKDPIIFGVISCSRRLYFIADWIDEYCDLTLEEVVTVIDKDLGKMTLNKESIVEPVGRGAS